MMTQFISVPIGQPLDRASPNAPAGCMGEAIELLSQPSGISGITAVGDHGMLLPVADESWTIEKRRSQAEQLLSALWPSQDAHHQLATKQGSGPFRPHPVTDLEASVALAIEWSDQGRDCYHACGEFNTPENRKAENVAGAGCAWMDVDCGPEKAATGAGYEHPAAAMEALSNFCRETGILEPSHVVNSGGGWHVYWVLDTVLQAADWQRCADRLKTLAKHHGFHADPTRTADRTSVLRLPGTLNHKSQPPRRVTLVKATQPLQLRAFLDSIDAAYARVPQPPVKQHGVGRDQEEIDAGVSSVTFAFLSSVVDQIDPDVGRDDWVRVLMAIFWETKGSDQGLSLAIEWSRQGEKFEGAQSVETTWRSFRLEHEPHVGIGTLIKMAKEAEVFTPQATEIVQPARVDEPAAVSPPITASTLPFVRFSMRDRVEELESRLVDQVFLMGRIALTGELTVIYAAPNTGKTLLALYLLCGAIESGVIDPEKVIYVNVDDGAHGLTEKMRIARDNGFHMISDGQAGFSISLFEAEMERMISGDTAAGTVVILDTLKKFTDLMNKGKCAEFSTLLRRFTAKGGSVIALAHTNKNPGLDGKRVPGGTSDIVDDFDCAYVLEELSNGMEGCRVVQFRNLKARGGVADIAGYQYDKLPELSYLQRLASVQPVDSATLEPLQEAAAQAPDVRVIEAIKSCIREGINSRMELAVEAAKRAGSGRNAVASILQKYAGEDRARHHWRVEVVARGKKIHSLIEPVVASSSVES